MRDRYIMHIVLVKLDGRRCVRVCAFIVSVN